MKGGTCTQTHAHAHTLQVKVMGHSFTQTLNTNCVRGFMPLGV